MAEDTAEIEAPPKSNKMMLILIITVVVLILLVAGFGAYMIASSGSEPAPAEVAVAEAPAVAAQEAGVPPSVAFAPKNILPPKFETMRPAFTANFIDGDEVRYIQVAIDLMARDEEVLDKIKENTPVIRHQFNKILSKQDATILTQEAKDVMEAELLEAAKTIIHNTNKKTPENVEAVYFTSFVIQ